MILFLFHLFLSSLVHKITPSSSSSSSPSPTWARRSPLISVHLHIHCWSSQHHMHTGDSQLRNDRSVPVWWEFLLISCVWPVFTEITLLDVFIVMLWTKRCFGLNSKIDWFDKFTLHRGSACKAQLETHLTQTVSAWGILFTCRFCVSTEWNRYTHQTNLSNTEHQVK